MTQISLFLCISDHSIIFAWAEGQFYSEYFQPTVLGNSYLIGMGVLWYRMLKVKDQLLVKLAVVWMKKLPEWISPAYDMQDDSI